MPKHTLYLVTHERGQHPITGKTKPYHWSYFIQIKLEDGANEGIAHQLHGMPGSFYYKGPENVDLSKSGDLKEELEVGEVDGSLLDSVHEVLENVRIDSVESSGWNCQDWALDGFTKLKEKGFVYDHLTPEAVKNWLKET
ncbi:hypothetical protein GGS23DRAFT_55065 [Durotheca rogersii]|uniref:uncharacterized protein n=1 Tax=Durotheca rogersii TaxID=419775 RepID=UPI00221F38C5|nr:uncharacterized protein GGS23DRAFT_55065 [Durotheca rogersii]KAI5863133.1 hypothetical protein GGS23DRAFT_55065 [Durotheca rogersii]